jgi:hypothetical protein
VFFFSDEKFVRGEAVYELDGLRGYKQLGGGGGEFDEFSKNADCFRMESEFGFVDDDEFRGVGL